jgi:hypothetical protein
MLMFRRLCVGVLYILIFGVALHLFAPAALHNLVVRIAVPFVAWGLALLHMPFKYHPDVEKLGKALDEGRFPFSDSDVREAIDSLERMSPEEYRKMERDLKRKFRPR